MGERAYEDDGGRERAGLREQVPDARGGDAGEHLDELGAVGGEERDASLPRHGLRQVRLSRARRPLQQHALAVAHRQSRVDIIERQRWCSDVGCNCVNSLHKALALADICERATGSFTVADENPPELT